MSWARGLTYTEDLPFEERSIFGTITNDEALFFQEAFALHESGQLEDSTYLAYLDWFSSILVTPGGALWWKTTGRPIYVPEMVAAVDKRLAAGGLYDIRSLPSIRLDKSTNT